MTRRPRALAIVTTFALGAALAACGSQGNSVDNADSGEPANIKNGARLFVERCAGCHTMDVVGAEGGATQIHDRERVDGPDFNVRREDVDSVLYAIRNGGFSGAIMPENIVVGQDARDVAEFLAKYAGGPRKGRDITPESQEAAGGGAGGGGAGGGETTATGGQTTPTTTTEGGGEQASARGKQVFAQNCAGCHVLQDANASGQVGPDLDARRPDAQTVQRMVEQGSGAMPSFQGRLSDSDIQAVSQYVSSVAGE